MKDGYTPYMTACLHRQRSLAASVAVFGVRLLCCTALVAVAAPAHAVTLPGGGQYVAGSGSIASVGNTTTINQSSSRGIINWNSFSIGAGGVVNFNNGTGETLNRVVGGNLSQIDGLLHATGSVYLINPNGVVIGAGGKVLTNGSFVASTRDMANADFMNGTDHFTGSSAGDVVNLGTINSKTGDVALIGHGVTNHGDIEAANGVAVLAAGDDVYLHPVDGAQGLYIKPQKAAGGDVTTDGQVKAAAVAIEAAQGNVYALAGNHGGLIEATGTQTKDGQVWLMADNGTTTVGTAIHAQNADGTGGSIETSGHNVQFESDAAISTSLGGSWLIDPEDLTIDATAASILSSALNGGTSITEQTTFTGGGVIGNTASGDGDIDVNSAINWSTGATLTLDAFHSVNINAPVTISGGGGLVVNTNNNVGGSSTGDGVFNVDMAGGASVQFTGGSGTLSINGDAYTLLYTMSDMENMTSGSAYHYALAAPIDATSYSGFTPIGTGGATINFDGLGNTISNLYITSSAVQNVALWGDLTGGSIENFGLIGGKVTNTYSAGSITSTASLIGVSHINIRNVFSTMDVESDNGSSTYSYTGGLVGMVSAGDLNDVYATGTVTSDNASGDRIGGLVGALGGTSTSTIENAYATGDVTSAGTAFIGGLLGYLYDTSSVDTVHAAGTVTENGIAGYVGGLIGYIPGNNGIINNVYASGDVIDTAGGNSSIGGLVGDSHTDISNAYATGDITSSNNDNGRIGGLVGASGAMIDNSYATGSISVTDDTDTTSSRTDIGGLVGYQNVTGSITNAHASGTVSSTDGTGDNVGGLIGSSDSGSIISNAYAEGDISLNSPSNTGNAGGLAGVASAAITNSYATGNVTITAGDTDGLGATVNSTAGGLVGTYSTSTITMSYATGKVSGTADDIAGFVGYNNKGTMSQSHATGDIDLIGGSIAWAGGLVAWNSGTITDSYATGDVTNENGSNNRIGGLVGAMNSASAAIINSYAIGDVTMTDGTSGYAIGGLVGLNTLGTISGSHATGAVNATSYNTTTGNIGGLVGTNNDTITNSYATGTVTTTKGSRIGGLVGANGVSTSVIQNSYASGAVSTDGGNNDSIGGLVGFNAVGAVTESSYATGDVSNTNGNTNYIGGLIGNDNNGISDEHAAGNVTVSNCDNCLVGGLVGTANAAVENAYATGNITLTDSNSGSGAGGLAGTSKISITNSYATGDVAASSTDGTGSTGGLSAFNPGDIEQSYATGDVTTTNLINTGGLVGQNSSTGTVNLSYATGDVSAETTVPNSDVGGLIGLNLNSDTNSYAVGNISGFAEYMGGHTGYVASGTTNDSIYSTGNVTVAAAADCSTLGSCDTGGLIGISNSSISNAYSTGNVYFNGGTASNWYIGGFAGYSNAAGAITNSYATGNVTAIQASGHNAGQWAISAFLGENSGSVDNAWSTGSVNVDATGANSAYSTAFIAGFLGRNNDGGTVSNVYSTGDVTATLVKGYARIGGLIATDGSDVTNAYSTSNIVVTETAPSAANPNQVGGLIAWYYNGIVKNAYAMGNITVTSPGIQNQTGGLVGYVQSGAPGLENVYATGKVTDTLATDTVGGLIGENNNGNTITNGFWNVQTTGQQTASGNSTTSGGATGLTTAQWFSENPVDTGAFSSADWVLGYPYPVLKALPYIQATANGTLAQGSSAISATTTSAVDQNGVSAAGKIGGSINWLSNANGGSTVGNYKLGQTGAVATGYQVAYTGTLTVTAPNKNVTGTGTVPLPPVAPASADGGTSIQTSSNGLAPLPILIDPVIYSPDETFDINMSRGLAVYAAPSQAMTSSWMAHRFGIKLDIATGYIVLSR